jgi:hypothetical protein
VPKHLTTNDETNFVTADIIGAVNGVAQLGADGKVPDAQLPTVLTGSVDSVNGKIGNVTLSADDVGAVPVSQKGANNGVPQLDSTGRIPAAQLPSTALQSTSLGVASGIATLDSSGKLTAAQIPPAPVTSVNTKTGAVALTASDVNAIPTSQKAAANGVASLDSNTLVPLAQIPSLATLYQPVPGSTPAKPNMVLSAIAGGSNSAKWAEPLVYTASSAAAMPSGVPTGSLCVRTDSPSLYQYTGSAWVTLAANQQGWQTLPLPSGTRSYTDTSVPATFVPQYRRIGNQVWIKGRIELTSGGTFPGGYSLPLPTIIAPANTIDAPGTSTTGGGQIGVCRWQINPDFGSGPSMVFFAGSGPNPSTTWLGFNVTYMLD